VLYSYPSPSFHPVLTLPNSSKEKQDVCSIPFYVVAPSPSDIHATLVDPNKLKYKGKRHHPRGPHIRTNGM